MKMQTSCWFTNSHMHFTSLSPLNVFPAYFSYRSSGMRRVDSFEKTLMLGKEEKGTTEDKMVRWHHQHNGHEFEQTPGESEGQGSMVCCSPWSLKESDTSK